MKINSIYALCGFLSVVMGMMPENHIMHSPFPIIKASTINKNSFKSLVEEKYPQDWLSILNTKPKCNLHKDITAFERFIGKHDFQNASKMLRRLKNYHGHYYNYERYTSRNNPNKTKIIFKSA